MKKFLLIIVSSIFVIGMASVVWATIAGTPHDLAPEPCAMCHTPHAGMGDYPLWNRIQPPQTYILYDSSSFDMGPALQPRFPSKLCLVCHNGVASELVNYPGPGSIFDPTYNITIAGIDALGLDLTNEHPVSFDYNSTLDLDGNEFPVATATGTRGRMVITGATSGTQYWLYGEGTTLNWFECATCHAVHDTATYVGKGVTQVYFLRGTNEYSTMCMDCHTAR